ncbi:TonB-dependent siderophore receptor [Sphingomonas sp. DG1-23]|uniref:TonB-dependent siderophore receptor n=1 Tax=Sphingomonas sp. DG1-23 TaxID=3068316 RepID=UPI00273F38CE|nr:TonB-dependent siderophore receptor [Sphingomonas sp. DG1-23]MDP5279824.1 TonB-dependent siderophore receptor [Sphingomonas sp. DG1-23]
MGRINRAIAAAQFALLAASVASPPTVQAHSRDEPREEPEVQAGAGQDAIVVTGLRETATGSGTKTDAPLIEIPQTITVIDERELALRNATSINQAVGYVAGVAANQRGGTVTRYDQLLLRGFAPGLYLDGMRLIAGPYSTPQTDFNRIDQIDIVKGPASVLYGNSTPGGLINLSSKKPQETAFGRVELQAGNYDALRAMADVNQPLTADGTLLFRIVGGWQKNDGFTPGTESERYHVSPMVTFAPGPDTSLTLIAAYQHAPSGGGYSGVPAYGTVLPSPAGRLTLHVNTGDPGYERYDHKQKAITALFRHDFDEHLSFRSNFRYQNNTLSYRQLYVAGYATTGTGINRNSDYGTIIRGGGGADEDFDTLTLDNHLSAKFATGPLHHHLLAGIDYQYIAGENFQQFNTGQTGNPLTSIPNLNLYAPVYGGTLPSLDLTALSPNFVNTYTKRDQVGLYLQDQASIGRLQLIASGRWDWYNQTAINKKLASNNVTRLSQAAFTMRLGALYELGFGLSPYVSYSESFEPQTGTTYLGAPFDPVTGKMIETGLKYQPAGINALFTLSVYDLRRQKVPVADPLGGTNGIPTNSQVQIGEVRVRGVELEGRGQVMPGLDVILAAAYTDAIITQGAPSVPPTATNSGTPSTTGTRQLGTPEWQASTFLAYDFAKAGHEGAVGGLTLGAGVRYVSGSAGSTNYAVISNVTTFQGFMTEDFTLVDGVVGYDLAYLGGALRGWSVAVNAANLLDARYISACPFSNSCYFGASRTVTGSLRFKW